MTGRTVSCFFDPVFCELLRPTKSRWCARGTVKVCSSASAADTAYQGEHERGVR